MDPSESKKINEAINLKEVMEKTDFNAIPRLESLIGQETNTSAVNNNLFNNPNVFFNMAQQNELSNFVNQMNNSLNVQPEQAMTNILQSQYYGYILQQLSMNNPQLQTPPPIQHIPQMHTPQTTPQPPHTLPVQGNFFNAKVAVNTPYGVPMPQNVLGWKEFYEHVKNTTNTAEFKSEAAFLQHVNRLWDTLERYERQYYIESSLLAGKQVNFVLQRFKCANYECTLLARTFADRGKFYCSDACLIQDVKKNFGDMFADKKKIAPINNNQYDDKHPRKRPTHIQQK